MKILRHCITTLMILFVTLPPAAHADDVTSIGVTSVERVSLDANGQESPDEAIGWSDISDDGNIVVFETQQRLVETDLDDFSDIYVRNRQAGTIVRASQPPPPASPDNDSYVPRISGDGRYVVFGSIASNLVAVDPNGNTDDVFVYDVQTGGLTRIDPDPIGPGVGIFARTISGNGRYLAYGQITTRNSVPGIYLTRYDRQTDTLVVFENSRITQPNAFHAAYFPHVTNDGCVVFATDADLVPGDQNGKSDIYAIGCPERNPDATSMPFLITRGYYGGITDGNSLEPHGTPDGRYVVFSSNAFNLVAEDNWGQYDIFLYDVDEDEFSRVSVDSNGSQSFFASYEPNISTDGRFVTWYEAGDLDADPDLNNADDVFIRDRVTGQTRRISKQPGVDSDGASRSPAVNGDGGAVVYHSYATNLVANDNNATGDFFVSNVRVPADEPAHGDLDGDDRGDLIWRDTVTGDNWISLLDGFEIRQSVPLNAVDTQWEIQARGDFNGDRKADIFWRHSTGANAIWLMSATHIASSAFITNVADPAWNVMGIGDFDDDGKDDLFWRNSGTGQTAVWLMNGFALKSSHLLTTVPLDWVVVGVGDFDADGKDDLSWRHSNGQNAIWLLNGGTIKSSAYLLTIGAPWFVAGVADFDGDGCADLLWRNGANGQNALWLMDGFTLRVSGYLSTVDDLNWNMKVLSDLDGDERADIYWRNEVTGEVYTWLMGGFSLLEARSGGFSSLQYILIE